MTLIRTLNTVIATCPPVASAPGACRRGRHPTRQSDRIGHPEPLDWTRCKLRRRTYSHRDCFSAIGADRNDNRRKGFTLVELLVVISIITILSAFSLPAFTGFQKSQTINDSAKKLKSDLRYIQNKSTASVNGKAWGVHFTNNSTSYQFFYCDPDSTHYNEYLLSVSSRCHGSTVVSFVSPSVVIKSTALSDLVFDNLNGTVVADGALPGGDITLTVSFSDDSASKTLTLGRGGRIED